MYDCLFATFYPFGMGKPSDGPSISGGFGPGLLSHDPGPSGISPPRFQDGNSTAFLENSSKVIWGFPEMGVPPNGWFIRENPTKKG